MFSSRGHLLTIKAEDDDIGHLLHVHLCRTGHWSIAFVLNIKKDKLDILCLLHLLYQQSKSLRPAKI